MELVKKYKVQEENNYINLNRLYEVKSGTLFEEFITDILTKKSKRMGYSYTRRYCF